MRKRHVTYQAGVSRMNLQDYWVKAATQYGIALDVEYGLNKGDGIFMGTEWLFETVEASVEQGWKYEFDADGDEVWEVAWDTWQHGLVGTTKTTEAFRVKYIAALKEAIQDYLNSIAPQGSNG
jgi:hypothetical protein